jgi:hypothetical protein
MLLRSQRRSEKARVRRANVHARWGLHHRKLKGRRRSGRQDQGIDAACVSDGAGLEDVPAHTQGIEPEPSCAVDKGTT